MYLQFYYCKQCGKIIAVVLGTKNPTFCCNKSMCLITPNLSQFKMIESDTYTISKCPRLTYRKEADCI